MRISSSPVKLSLYNSHHNNVNIMFYLSILSIRIFILAISVAFLLCSQSSRFSLALSIYYFSYVTDRCNPLQYGTIAIWWSQFLWVGNGGELAVASGQGFPCIWSALEGAGEAMCVCVCVFVSGEGTN